MLSDWSSPFGHAKGEDEAHEEEEEEKLKALRAQHLEKLYALQRRRYQLEYTKYAEEATEVWCTEETLSSSSFLWCSPSGGCIVLKSSTTNEVAVFMHGALQRRLSAKVDQVLFADRDILIAVNDGHLFRNHHSAPSETIHSIYTNHFCSANMKDHVIFTDGTQVYRLSSTGTKYLVGSTNDNILRMTSDGFIQTTNGSIYAIKSSEVKYLFKVRIESFTLLRVIEVDAFYAFVLVLETSASEANQEGGRLRLLMASLGKESFKEVLNDNLTDLRISSPCITLHHLVGYCPQTSTVEVIELSTFTTIKSVKVPSAPCNIICPFYCQNPRWIAMKFDGNSWRILPIDSDNKIP